MDEKKNVKFKTNALGLERAAFVGLSYGGWLALNLALKVPERVTRLALLAPAAGLRPFSWRFYLTFLLMAPLAFGAPTLRLLIGTFSARRSQIPSELARFVAATSRGGCSLLDFVMKERQVKVSVWVSGEEARETGSHDRKCRKQGSATNYAQATKSLRVGDRKQKYARFGQH